MGKKKEKDVTYYRGKFEEKDSIFTGTHITPRLVEELKSLNHLQMPHSLPIGKRRQVNDLMHLDERRRPAGPDDAGADNHDVHPWPPLPVLEVVGQDQLCHPAAVVEEELVGGRW